MTILTGTGYKFLEEFALGTHVLSEGTPDTIMVALYGPDASITPALDQYTTDGEISGGSYSAGGIAVPLTVVGRTGSARNDGLQFSESSYVQPTSDLSLTISGVAIRGCLMYNASKSNRTIFTLDFGTNFTPTTGLSIQWGVAGVSAYDEVLIPILAQVT